MDEAVEESDWFEGEEMSQVLHANFERVPVVQLQVGVNRETQVLLNLLTQLVQQVLQESDARKIENKFHKKKKTQQKHKGLGCDCNPGSYTSRHICTPYCVLLLSASHSVLQHPSLHLAALVSSVLTSLNTSMISLS